MSSKPSERKEPLKEVPKLPVEKPSKAASNEIPKETPKQPIEETSKAPSNEITKEIPKQASKAASNEITKETLAVTEKKKKKKGFKKAVGLEMPKGMEKLMASIQGPIKEVENMMVNQEKAELEDFQAQSQFHRIGL